MAEHIIQSGGDINSAPVKPGDVVLVEPGEYRGVGLSVPNVIYESIEPRGAKTGQWYFESGANTVQILGFVVTTGDQGGAFILNRANKNNRINNCEVLE